LGVCGQILSTNRWSSYPAGKDYVGVGFTIKASFPEKSSTCGLEGEWTIADHPWTFVHSFWCCRCGLLTRGKRAMWEWMCSATPFLIGKPFPITQLTSSDTNRHTEITTQLGQLGQLAQPLWPAMFQAFAISWLEGRGGVTVVTVTSCGQRWLVKTHSSL
jgi:hypothetical protein